MTSAYVNYPQPSINLHPGQSVHPATLNKAEPRIVEIDSTSLCAALKAFHDKKYKFGSTSAINDLWLIVDLGDEGLERHVVELVRRLLAQHYTRFDQVSAL